MIKKNDKIERPVYNLTKKIKKITKYNFKNNIILKKN
jgi:hypothetical protein